MKNLHLLMHSVHTFNLAQSTLITHFCVDDERNVIYAITNKLALISFNPVSRKLSLLELPLDPTSSIISLVFIPDTFSLCIAALDGGVYTLIVKNNLDDLTTDEVECVGTIDGGILAMSWSPDYELVVFLTRSLNIVIMTQDWELVHCDPLISENEIQLIEEQLATIKPSATKLNTIIQDIERLRVLPSLPSADETINNDTLSRYNKGASSSFNIVWRGDGAYFAITSPIFDDIGIPSTFPMPQRIQCPKGSTFRVWHRSGKLESRSESSPQYYSTQSSTLDWSSSGEYLTSSQWLSSGEEQVIFFERNGLRHHEFSIRYPSQCRATIQYLHWNSTSDILAVVLNVIGNDSSSVEDSSLLSSVVQFWTTGNYHWYLKREFIYPNQPHIFFKWNLEKGTHFHIITSNGQLDQGLIVWDIDTTIPRKPIEGKSQHSDPCFYQQSSLPSIDSNHLHNMLDIGHSIPDYSTYPNHSTIAVIDGHQLYLTSLKYQIIPPPMASLKLDMDISPTQLGDHAISQVIFMPYTDQILVQLSSHRFLLYEAYKPPVYQQSSLKPPSLMSNQSPPRLLAQMSQPFHLRLFQITPISATTLIALDTVDSRRLVHISFNPSNPLLTFAIINQLSVPQPILLLNFNPYTHVALCEYFEGSISQIDDQDLHLTPLPHHSFSMPCFWIQSAFLQDLLSIIGLTAHYRLIIDNNIISTQCSSFALHHGFLLFTTLTHSLQFLSLDHSIQDNLTILNSANQANRSALKKYDMSRREVEAGARLVLVVPEETRVVLQMPRGNLEVIEPRALIHYTLQQYLNRRAYRQAFDLMQKQRVDLNFFCDYRPQDFVDHLDLFVGEIQNPDDLHLFLSNLSIEDCTKTTLFNPWQKRKRDLDDWMNHPYNYDQDAFHIDLSGNEPSELHSSPTTNLDILQVLSSGSHAPHLGIDQTEAQIYALKIGKGRDHLPVDGQQRSTASEYGKAKVNIICDLLGNFMQRNTDNQQRYLFPILTSYACKIPSDIESALTIVQQCRSKEPKVTQSTETNISTPLDQTECASLSSRAIDCLLYHIDVNVLYDHALGLYDFNLVLLIAQKSQKDPREYLPWLEKLSTYPQYLRRFHIDKKLGRFKIALKHLLKAEMINRSDQILEFVKDHELYSNILSPSFSTDYACDELDPQLTKRLLEAYGDWLQEKCHDYHRAALVYRAGSHFSKAYEAVQCDEDWKQIIELGLKLEQDRINPKAWQEKLESLAKMACAKYQFKEAALIYEQYCSSPKEALTALLRGHLWQDSNILYQRHQHIWTQSNIHQAEHLIASQDGSSMDLNLSNLVISTPHDATGSTSNDDECDAKMNPGLQEILSSIKIAHETWMDDIRQWIVKLIKYHNRLVTIRANKYLQAQNQFSSAIEGSETSSLYSSSGFTTDSSYTASSSSRLTARSSMSSASTLANSPQSTRKHCKKISGRKGSRHEETYLTRELKQLVPSDKVMYEIKDCLEACFQHGWFEQVNKLENLINEWTHLSKRTLDLINTPSPLTIEQEHQQQVDNSTKTKLVLALVNPVPLKRIDIDESSSWKLNLLS